jgi:hypothetical protein
MGPEESRAMQDAQYAEDIAGLMQVIDSLTSEVFA